MYRLCTKEKSYIIRTGEYMIRTSEEAISALKALDEALGNIQTPETLNVFNAVGMTTQEVKHSAFFAWLLDPDATHGMGNAFLADFLKSLCNYPPYGDAEIATNRDILAGEDFDKFLNATDIKVETEKTLSGPESRIDIFIRSQQANTVLVIENKVFTSTHDDQLRRYEEEIKVFDGSKIKVYLTPKGDIPTDIDGNYQPDWCIFSYEKLLEILKKRLRTIPATKQFYKLRFLLEDYIEMVDATILKNNPSLRSMCKDILKRHADALEILMEYNDNVDDVYEYIANTWIPANIPNLAELEYKGRQLRFYTQPIADFYAKHNHPIKINPAYWAVCVNLGSKDGPIILGFGLGKNAEGEWEEADVIIRNLLVPEKKMGNKFCTLFTVELLSAEERQNKFEDIKTTLDERLSLFLTKLHDLENTLSKM